MFRGTISAPPGNVGNVTVAGPDGGSTAWIPGEYHDFEAINLQDLTGAGTVADTLTIVGESA